MDNSEQHFEFLYSPVSAQRFSLQNVMFNANLQEFAQAVEHIYQLIDRDEITSLEATKELERLYNQLQDSADALGIQY